MPQNYSGSRSMRRNSLFRLRFQMGMGQSEGLKKYRNLRKDRARLLTVLNEKKAAGETIPRFRSDQCRRKRKKK